MSFDLDCGVRLSLLLNLNVVKMSSSNIKFYFIIFNLLVLCCDLYIVNFCFEKKKKISCLVFRVVIEYWGTIRHF